MNDFPTLERCARFGTFFLHMTYVTWALDLTARTMVQGSPVTPELYGPLVYIIPAFVWFAAQIGSSLFGVLGALWGGPIGMRMIMLGGVLQAIVFGFFARASSEASQGLIVHTGSIHHAVPLALLTVGVAIYIEGQRN